MSIEIIKMKKNNFNKWGIAIILFALISAIGTVAYFYLKQETQKMITSQHSNSPKKK